MVLSTPFLQGGSNLKSVNEILEVVIQTKATAHTKNWHVPPTPPPHPISHSYAALTHSAMPHPSPVSHSPFEPQTAIVRGLLDLCSSRRQAFPA